MKHRLLHLESGKKHPGRYSGLYPQPVYDHRDLPGYKIYYPWNPLPGNGNRCGKAKD